MNPLALTSFTATSCIGRGVEATLATLRAQRTGLAPCVFETVTLDTCVGEVAGVDEAPLPATLREFECRNNRLALLGLAQDGFAEAVKRAASRHGRERVGVFLGTSTSGILETELAYRRRDPVSGTLPAHFRYRGAHNSFSLAAFAQQALQLSGPAVVISCACSSRAKVFASGRRADAGRGDQPRLDRAPGRGEHLGAGRARARDHHGRTRQLQGLLRERRERERVVRAAVAKVRRQRTAHRVALAVGELGLEDARGAGAEKHPDALAPVAGGGALHRLGKTVLHEAEVGQAIVATLELVQPRRERGVIHARHLAHPGVEPHRLEGARDKPGAPLAQRGERGGNTATDE